jgi:hypothetical protein
MKLDLLVFAVHPDDAELSVRWNLAHREIARKKNRHS